MPRPPPVTTATCSRSAPVASLIRTMIMKFGRVRQALRVILCRANLRCGHVLLQLARITVGQRLGIPAELYRKPPERQPQIGRKCGTKGESRLESSASELTCAAEFP